MKKNIISLMILSMLTACAGAVAEAPRNGGRGNGAGGGSMQTLNEGIAYMNGDGVDQDYEKALQLFLEACEAGSLTQLEGEDVYDDMILTATCFISDPAQIPAIAAWLKGSGTVTFANRTGGYYKARIANRSLLKRCSGAIRTVLSRSTSAVIRFSMPMPPLT